MKSRLIYLAAAAFLIISLVSVAIPSSKSLAATAHVYSGQSIQEAINASAAGDTVIVHDGTYNENIFIDKPLTFISDKGSASTIIDGTAGGDQAAVTIINSSVTFGTAGHGFGVTHTWYDAGNESGGMGIAVFNAGDGVITSVSIEGNYIYDCGGGPGGSGAGIALGNMGTGSLDGNNVSGNEVFNCSMGIVMINMGAADIHGNTIEDNLVHMAAVPVGLINFAPGAESYGNNILDNEIYDSGFCILLSGFGGNIHGNIISGNTVHDSFLGITLGEVAGFSGIAVYENIVEDNEAYNCGGGIVLAIEGTGSVLGNVVMGNTVHNMSPIDTAPGCGLSLSNMGPGNVSGNTLNDNTAYNCVTGVRIWNSGTGVLQDSWICGNSIYNNSEGIDISSAQYVSIYGNDIMDNYGGATGILILNSDEIDVKCNNIAGNNACGIESSGSTNVDANDNWWGDAGGPGSNGSNAICGMTVDTWLSEEHLINAEAAPASIPDGDDYSAMLSVEQQGADGCCNASSVEIDLGVLLLDLLPEDFEQRYVSTWDAGAQLAWGDWLDSLDDTEMYLNESAWNYEFDLETLLFDESTGLKSFFSYEGGETDYTALICGEELRPGNHRVPVYIAGNCSTQFTSFIPITITATPVLSFNLTYAAGTGGTITGDTLQTVGCGGNGSEVTAVPNACYRFIRWSDNSLNASRTDTNVMNNIFVTAVFAYRCGGGYVPPEPTPTATPGPTPTITPGPTSTPAPSPAPISETTMTITFQGTGAQDKMDDTGVLLADINSSSPDGTITARIAAGTQITDPSGQPIDGISIEAVANTPTMPEGYFLIQAYDFEPDGTVFSSALQIIMLYDMSQLPAGQQPVIAYYDEAAGEWFFLIGAVDTAAGTITFSITHFTTYALIGLSTTPGGGGDIAPWVWILIGFAVLLAVVLFAGTVMRRRAAMAEVESRFNQDDDYF